jgi:curved DNA-binding protein CbpA
MGLSLIDFSVANAGEIGKNDSLWFSDLYYAAVNEQFTGGILIAAGGDRAIFFDGGRPVHASGQGFSGHYLGELLLREKKVEQSVVASAIRRQQSENPRPLLGAILVQTAQLDPAVIKRAMQVQTQRRVLELFALSEGSWKSAPGKDARIFQIGVPVDPWPILLQGLVNASDRELRVASDLMLGKAVSLAHDASKLAGFGLDENARKVLKYLEKPRKPDQLERAVGNRKLVRAVLRLLQMEDALQLDPVAKAIAIPKATLVKPALPGASTSSVDIVPPPLDEVKTIVPKPRPASRAKIKTSDLPPLAKDMKEAYEGLKRKNYFELFGVSQNSPIDPQLLRKTYTNLAKKYHPDAFSSDIPDEIKTIALELSSRINEAYETLSDEKRRAEYLFLLADDRIKGDARKAELIRDAETKFKMGHVMLKKRDYQKAREFFKYSAESDPSIGAYRAGLAWAMFTDPDFDKEKGVEKAYELILEALGAKTIDAQTHYVAGQIMKARGEIRDAERHFRQAVKLDPKHQEAIRELRLTEMRAEKRAKRGDSKAKGGPLSKFFKRD